MPRPSDDEIRDLERRLASGDCAARDDLIAAWSWLCRRLGRGMERHDRDDVRAEGMAALVEVASAYRGEGGFERRARTAISRAVQSWKRRELIQRGISLSGWDVPWRAAGSMRPVEPVLATRLTESERAAMGGEPGTPARRSGAEKVRRAIIRETDGC